MTNLLVTWLLSAVSLLIVGYVVKGFDISGFGSALIAAVVVGLVNGTIGFFLKVVTFPLTILTLGLFWWVINAVMLKVAAALVPGFKINGFLPMLLGAPKSELRLDYATRKLSPVDASPFAGP